jgi:AcrR family transcriptional regulator
MAPYHHGDLRRALVDEALRQIGTRGIGGWSLREVAAALGVSHAAPYHHFRGRDELVAAVAAQGLERLDALMAEGQRQAGADPLDELLAIGMAYVQFAVERPDYFAAIEAAAAKPQSRRRPPPAPGPTWMRLTGAVAACQSAGRLPEGDPVIVAVSLWSLVHGLAELWKSGPLNQLPQAAGGLVSLADRVLRASVGCDRAIGRQPSAVGLQPSARGRRPMRKKARE